MEDDELAYDELGISPINFDERGETEGREASASAQAQHVSNTRVRIKRAKIVRDLQNAQPAWRTDGLGLRGAESLHPIRERDRWGDISTGKVTHQEIPPQDS